LPEDRERGSSIFLGDMRFWHTKGDADEEIETVAKLIPGRVKPYR